MDGQLSGYSSAEGSGFGRGSGLREAKPGIQNSAEFERHCQKEELFEKKDLSPEKNLLLVGRPHRVLTWHLQLASVFELRDRQSLGMMLERK